MRRVGLDELRGRIARTAHQAEARASGTPLEAVVLHRLRLACTHDYWHKQTVLDAIRYDAAAEALAGSWRECEPDALCLAQVV